MSDHLPEMSSNDNEALDLMDPVQAVSYLRSPDIIRQRSHQIFNLAKEDKLQHFSYQAEFFDQTLNFVIGMTKKNYPTFDIPYHSRWRHFLIDDKDFLKDFNTVDCDKDEKARREIELVIISVLLDAGAGADWTYRTKQYDLTLNRSEGLAIASLDLFLEGMFSSDKNQSFQVDIDGINSLSLESFSEAFQIRESNPLIGLEERFNLIKKLGSVISDNKIFQKNGKIRLGYFYDYLLNFEKEGQISAVKIFKALLETFQDIWPSHTFLEGIALGDVWEHSAIQTNDLTNGFVPFHKLTQWLTYSLLEPFEKIGIGVIDINRLTGLPEYRNGGLLIDMGLIISKHSNFSKKTYSINSEIIVEWRALTVAILDKIADKMRNSLKLTEEEFPLAKVLQGGTWSAGRAIAKNRREDSSPPIKFESKGTVF